MFVKCLRKGIPDPEGRQFLVIPMYNQADPLKSPPTIWVCPP